MRIGLNNCMTDSQRELVVAECLGVQEKVINSHGIEFELSTHRHQLKTDQVSIKSAKNTKISLTSISSSSSSTNLHNLP